MWEMTILSAATTHSGTAVQASNDGKFEGSSFNGDFSPST